MKPSRRTPVRVIRHQRVLMYACFATALLLVVVVIVCGGEIDERLIRFIAEVVAALERMESLLRR